MTMFTTVLVANRGEIACRIILALRELGIRSVAVYSDADRNARHVTMADAAVRIGEAPPQSSYLSISAVLAAAQRSGAEAIHPGYGFLSENVEFARACASAGIVFIGPGAEALQLMGDKIRAKNHVVEHGVPVIPGIAKAGLSDAELVAAASGIGFPLLIKPSAGGGGKGMHVVTEPGELAGSLASARRVAAAAFGDDTLFIEKLVTEPRHIEVQVLADNFGAVIHLGERECSLQRRHQKVVEEAPSALLDAETRRRIGAAACEVAGSVGYSGAGTVEFLVSAEEPTEFYFMEMNTRLQVEHPVTELVTGIDLVKWQVRIAAGEPLTIGQNDVRIGGHAVEARVYAENPGRGFLPTTGTVRALWEPTGAGIRVDSMLNNGLEIGSTYDPLLAKIIAHGDSREEALERLSAALASTRILGLATNLEFLCDLIDHPEVRAGRLDTGLIERVLPEIAPRDVDARTLAAAALFAHKNRPIGTQSRVVGSPWTEARGWRIGAHQPTGYAFATSATTFVEAAVSATGTAVMIDGVEHPAGLRAAGGAGGPHGEHPAVHSLECDGLTSPVWLSRDGDTVWVADGRSTHGLRLRSREAQLAEELSTLTRPDGAVSPQVRVPMPGTVVAVTVSDGDEVEAGDLLLSVEAMKMEHALFSPIAGIVSISVTPGDLVSIDQVVASITVRTPVAIPSTASTHPSATSAARTAHP